MEITRIGTTKRWSDIVVNNNTVYMVEVATDTNCSVKEQALQIFAAIDKNLEKVGSSRKMLLMVTIFLADISTIDEFNQVWEEWLPIGSAPVRACVQAKLANPEYKVELQVIAALDN